MSNIIVPNGVNGFNIDNDDPEKTAYEADKSGKKDDGVVSDKGKLILTPNAADNLKYIINDILKGDVDALERPEIKSLNLPNIKKALEWLSETNNLSDSMKASLVTDGWRMSFKYKPPTIKEFLTPQYIGEQATTLHWWVRETLENYFDPLSPYRSLILSSCIGAGKSTLASVANAYIATLFGYMISPYKWYGGSPSSQYTIVFGSYSQKKASELLLQPIMNILRQSSFFKQERTKDDLLKKSKTQPDGPCLYWSTAADTAKMVFSNGLNVNIVSSNGDIIGQNIIFGNVTEISFWRDEGGWSDERIYQFFTKLRDRIDNRMHGNRISGFLLDSSPNTLESAIDKWIWEEAPKDPKNYFFKGATWDFFKDNFIGCYDENGHLLHDWNKCFPMFKGGNGKLPRPVENENDLTQFDPIDIIWCPREESVGGVSLYDKAKSQPVDFLKDQAGIPTNTADRIFYNPVIIEDIFNNNLRNIEAHITAPASEEPEHLIWNQVRDIFFNKIVDKYYFYYEQALPRTVGVDQSYANDATGISMTHVERHPTLKDPETGEPLKVYVTDFTIVIIPKGGLINLDAIKCFIYDLKYLGNLNIAHASFDGFQSEPARQFLKRKGVEVEYASADKTLEPYLEYIDIIMHGRYFCGKNFYLKNNLKSLHMTTRRGGKSKKIDHTYGETVVESTGNWATDMRGINAKDAADSVVDSIWLIDKYSDSFIPYVTWNPDSQKSRDYDTVKSKTMDFLKGRGFNVY